MAMAASASPWLPMVCDKRWTLHQQTGFQTDAKDGFYKTNWWNSPPQELQKVDKTLRTLAFPAQADEGLETA